MTQPRRGVDRGRGGLPRVMLSATNGDAAEVYLHGAHVTSWRTADGVEQLYLSERAVFDGAAAIRGGIPVIFPQFAGEGPLPKHGFARTHPWELVDANPMGTAPFALLRLVDSPATRATWPHPFAAELRVSLGDDTLRVELTVTNTGREALAFTGALHTYLRVADAPSTTITGLQGVAYRDSEGVGHSMREERKEVAVAGGVNRIYLGATGPVGVREAHRERVVSSEGFPDVVLWNPGARSEAVLGDMEPGGSRHMVCVEAAAVGHPVRLSSGGRWTGSQWIRASHG